MNLNSGQVAAVSRHVVTFIMGGVAFMATLGVISATDAQQISTSIGEISKGVAEVAAGAAPIIAIVSAAISAWSASHKQQVAAVKSAVDSGAITGVQIVGTPTEVKK